MRLYLHQNKLIAQDPSAHLLLVSNTKAPEYHETRCALIGGGSGPTVGPKNVLGTCRMGVLPILIPLTKPRPFIAEGSVPQSRVTDDEWSRVVFEYKQTDKVPTS